MSFVKQKVGPKGYLLQNFSQIGRLVSKEKAGQIHTQAQIHTPKITKTQVHTQAHRHRYTYTSAQAHRPAHTNTKYFYKT